MIADFLRFLGRLAAWFWRGLTRLRVALSNLLFLAVLILLAVLFSGGAPEPLPQKAALRLDPVGTVVEQRTYVEPFAFLFREPEPEEREVLLQDLIDAVDHARDDPRITALVLELDLLLGVGLAKGEDIAAAIAAFRESGKPVVAWGDSFSQFQYYLATQADTVILHPMGSVAIEGLGHYQWYMREALDKLGVTANVFRAGDYKSALEPLTRNSMSDADREASGHLIAQHWARYSESVEARRGLPGGAIDRYAGRFDRLLAEQGGDGGELAKDYGLVDRLEGRRSANRYLVELVGAENDEGHYEAVSFERYLERRQPLFEGGGGRIGLLVAKGLILDGEQSPGAIGGDSLGKLIGRAARDDEVKAIVLRVDSGGGSAFASEVIRRQLRFAREQGKPVVVSMGSVAASGGYWIAADADQIWASPSTLTGSIGVFGIFPTLDALLGRLGVHVDGLGSTELAGARRADRPLDERLAAILQGDVDSLYRRFLGIVAEGRGLPVAEVEAIAGGRVWSGADALRLGLVDHLGGLQDAVAAAAELAGLEDYSLKRIAEPPTPQEMLAERLRRQTGLRAMAARAPGPLPAWLRRGAAPIRAELASLARLNDPGDRYALCDICLGM